MKFIRCFNQKLDEAFDESTVITIEKNSRGNKIRTWYSDCCGYPTIEDVWTPPICSKCHYICQHLKFKNRNKCQTN